jgi:hypothetical protein
MVLFSRPPQSQLYSAPHQQAIFDENVGFSIRQIEAVPNPNEDSSFRSTGNWKPPVHTNRFDLVNKTYVLRQRGDNIPDHTKFIWRSPRKRSSPEPAIAVMSQNEEWRWTMHRCASLIWSTNHQTFMHVPKDCTAENVEYEPHQDEDEAGNESSEDEIRAATWKRLRFKHIYPQGSPPISLARYGNAFLIDGRLKPSWNSFLIPPCHRSLHQHDNFAQLAGDLPILLGLVAACALSRSGAVQAIEDWFPPSQGQSDWNINHAALGRMLHASNSRYFTGGFFFNYSSFYFT